MEIETGTDEKKDVVSNILQGDFLCHLYPSSSAYVHDFIPCSQFSPYHIYVSACRRSAHDNPRCDHIGIQLIFFRKTLRTTDLYHNSEIKRIKSSKLTIFYKNMPILGSSFDSVGKLCIMVCLYIIGYIPVLCRA